MAARIVIVHGWASSPDDCWFPWLRRELERKGHMVLVPAMPNSKHPEPQEWLTVIRKVVGHVDIDTFFVAHSLGCRAVSLFLQELPPHEISGGAVFVAGTFIPPKKPHPHPAAQATRERWLPCTVDASRLLTHVRSIASVYSTNDPWVSLENATFTKDVLGAELFIEEEKGHFTGKMDGVYELPAVLTALENRGA